MVMEYLRDIALFVEVARAKNFARAAVKLGMPMLRQLAEANVGIALIEEGWEPERSRAAYSGAF